jgi:hypothetical protein
MIFFFFSLDTITFFVYIPSIPKLIIGIFQNIAEGRFFGGCPEGFNFPGRPAVCCASAQNRIKIHKNEFLYPANCQSLVRWQPRQTEFLVKGAPLAFRAKPAKYKRLPSFLLLGRRKSFFRRPFYLKKRFFSRKFTLTVYAAVAVICKRGRKKWLN